MKRNSDRIKSYGGGKIQSFESFGKSDFTVKNRYMNSVIESLSEMGVSIMDVEEPEWGADGLIELTESTQLNVSVGKNNKNVQGVLDLGNGKYEMTDKTEDIKEAMSQLKKLQEKHNMEDADYTSDFKETKPQAATPYLKEKRAEKVGNAAKLVENAIEELKRAPKLDMMTDIPELIEKLESILGESETFGLKPLQKLYENEK